MKKIFFFASALLASLAMLAEQQSLIILPTSGFLASYPSTDKTITVDEVEFAYANIQYNKKDGPKGYAKQQLIQLKKNEATITNNTELKGLESVAIVVKEQKTYKVVFGNSTDTIFSSDLKPDTVQASFIDTAGVTQQAEAYQYTFANPGKASTFKLTNGAGTGYYMYQMVITWDNQPQSIENKNAEPQPQNSKVIRDNQVIILRDGVRYNIIGQIIE